jgi:hypothetical protein
VSAARKVAAVPRDGYSHSRLARVGAFTIGVVLAERLFRSTDPAARTARLVDLYGDEVDAIKQSLGCVADVRLAAFARRALFG